MESHATHFTSRTRARIPAAMGAALDVPWKCSTQPSPLLVTVTWKHKYHCDMEESAKVFWNKRCADTAQTEVLASGALEQPLLFSTFHFCLPPSTPWLPPPAFAATPPALCLQLTLVCLRVCPAVTQVIWQASINITPVAAL